MNIARSSFRKAGVIGSGIALLCAATTGSLLAASTPAFAADVANSYGCVAEGQTVPQTINWSVSAPATVSAGGTLTASYTEPSQTVPATEDAPVVGEVTVVSISSLQLTFTAPTGTSISGTPSLTGGTGLGSSAPTVTVSGSTVVATAAGPVAGGASYTFPTVNIPLSVTGSSGSTINFGFPAFQFGVTITDNGTSIGPVTTACTPAAAPAAVGTAAISGGSTSGATTTTVAGTTGTTAVVSGSSTTAVASAVPSSAPATGGGGTARESHTPLLIVGGVALTFAGLAAYQRRRSTQALRSAPVDAKDS
jgi:dehydratase